MVEEVHEIDMNDKGQFIKVLKEKVPKPFIFGPIEFSDLHLPEDEYEFPHEEVRDGITRFLDRSPIMPPNLCQHGY